MSPSLMLFMKSESVLRPFIGTASTTTALSFSAAEFLGRISGRFSSGCKRL